MSSYVSFKKQWMIHVNLQTQFQEQGEIIKSVRSDEQMEFDMGKCMSAERSKGQPYCDQ